MLKSLLTVLRTVSVGCLVPRRAVATRRAVAVRAALPGVNDVEAGEVAHVHGTKHVLGVLVNLDALLDLEVDSGDVRDVVEALLALLLLQLEGNALDGATGDPLHHVGGEAGNLVAEALGRDQRNLIADALVGGEVQGEALVVALNHLLGSTLHGLVTNTAHLSCSIPM